MTQEQITAFSANLREREKSAATIEKYKHDLQELYAFANGRQLTKILLVEYKEKLQTAFKPQTVNGKLSAINSFLQYIGASELQMQFLRVQRKAFVDESRELSETEYKRLLAAANSCGNERLYHVMLAICGTGIRVSELEYVTVEAIRKGCVAISRKGKDRIVLVPKLLCKRLLSYAAKKKIKSGFVFQTRNGKPLDRSNIWSDMKALCKSAHVDPSKVFPHNLRHLFARTFYAIEKNLSHLADILGHSSIETTRIYVATSAREFEHTLSRMRLVV